MYLLLLLVFKGGDERIVLVFGMLKDISNQDAANIYPKAYGLGSGDVRYNHLIRLSYS